MLRIGLVGCCEVKSAFTGPAREVYASQLFKKSLAYSQFYLNRSYILSAEYGLLELDELVTPYNTKLTKRSLTEFVELLAPQLAELPLASLVVLAVPLYTTAVYEAAKTEVPIEEPMRGMSVCERLAYLTKCLRLGINAP